MPEGTVTKNNDNKRNLIAVAVVALFLVVALVLVVVRSNSPAVRVQKQLEIAQRYLEDLNYEQAIASYLVAIDIDPKCVDAYIGIADACIGSGDKQKALEYLKTGYELTEDERIKVMLDDLEAATENAVLTEQTSQNDQPSGKNNNDIPLNEIYNAISELWDYDVRGRAFDDWDVASLSAYIESNYTENAGSGDDSTTYILENGVSGRVFHDGKTVELSDSSQDGYYQFQTMDTVEMGSIVCYSTAPKFPIIGMSMDEFFGQFGVTIDEVLAVGEVYGESDDVSKQYRYTIKSGQYFLITVWDKDAGDYMVTAFDANRNYEIISFYTTSGIISTIHEENGY